MNMEEQIKGAIARNPIAAAKALILIYANQTLDERATEDTFHKNGAGFNAYDAPLLTRLAKQVQDWYLAGGSNGKYKYPLSVKQLAIVRDRLPKYWKQLVPHVEKKSSTQETGIVKV